MNTTESSEGKHAELGQDKALIKSTLEIDRDI
jgi:hypothetical protein